MNGRGADRGWAASSRRHGAIGFVGPGHQRGSLAKTPPFFKSHPDIKIETTLDNGLKDILSEGGDAGVRRGEHQACDMISTRIGPNPRHVVVAAPEVCEANPEPYHPRDQLSRKAGQL